MERKAKGKKSAKLAKRVAVIGYGSQGRAIALNLRDSGFEIILGLRTGSGSRKKARADKISQIVTVRQAVEQADIICFAFPDHLHGRVYAKEIAPYLKSGATLWFLHGTSLAFGFVKPPRNCDVIMIAPHAPGNAVREKYLTDRTISAFYAIAQDHSRHALKTIVELAGGIGFEKKRLIKTTVRDESIGDLFGEQAVLCGGLAMLIRNGFDVLVEHGLKPEHAYLEVAYQLDLIIALIKKHGIEGMLERISVAARLGSIESGPKVIDTGVKSRMEKVLKSIESGQFPRRLNSIDDRTIKQLNGRVKELSRKSLEKAARKFKS
jgi:ketol-acid reductoisomerase